jgi:hypothetical protein
VLFVGLVVGSWLAAKAAHLADSLLQDHAADQLSSVAVSDALASDSVDPVAQRRAIESVIAEQERVAGVEIAQSRSVGRAIDA